MTSTTDFNALAAEYENSLRVLGFRPKTLSETRRMLDLFFDWLAGQEITHLEAITRDVIKSYQVAQYERLNARGVQSSVRYQNALISVVGRFMGYLQETGLIIANPARGIRCGKLPQSLPRTILTPKEARGIIHAPDTKSVIGYRDRTILELLYSGGLRKSEIENLKLADVDYHEGFLRVNDGKGGKDRVVPIGRIACRYLENYIKSVRPELIRDPLNNHLFLSLRGNKINQNMIWVLVKKYAKKAKAKKNVHPHTFRHSCATSMLKNKAGLHEVQKMLGHESLKTTQVYIHLSITDLKEVHSRCHPRERDA